MMTGETDVPGEKKNGFSAAWFTTNPTRTVVFVSTDVRKLLKKKIRIRAASSGTTFIPSLVKIDHLGTQTQAKPLFFSPQMREAGLKNISN